MTPGGGAPTLTLTSGLAETGKGLYGTGDTGALISTGSKTAVEYTPPTKYEYSAADYTPEQPTEQRVTLPETVVEAKKESSPPPSVAEEKVAPPEVTIDLIKDFDWTASINKQQLQDKIPYIRLKEFKITADNALNAIAAGVFAWSDMQKSGAGALSKAAGVAGAAMDQVDFLKNIKDSKFSKVIADQAGVLGNSIDSFVESAKQAVGKISTPTDFGPEGQHLQDVYGGLYARESTGRTYIFPYFDNDYFQASNTFDESTTIPFMNEAFEAVSAAANTLPALVEPGVYVQRPKFYKFDSGENQISFSVTLYNTITPMAYLQNSKLVQQLIVNNLPRRKDKVVVEPPCIYEVLIPGKAFFPYCFISDLRVLHVGTKRLMEGEIVPDAFEIQLTIKSLTTDANNFYEKQMQHHEMTFPPPSTSDLSFGPTAADDENAPADTKQPSNAAAEREAIAQPAQQALPGPAGPVEPGDEAQPTETGRRAAAKALELAESNARLKNGQARDGHHCAAGVKTALLASGAINSYPGSNADIHAKNAGGWLRSQGYTLTNITDPRKAPIGAVTVYDGSGSGHIDIKSVDRRGNTKYVSDVVRDGPAHMPVKGVWVKK